MNLLRTIARDAGLAIGGAYLVLCAVVIAASAIGDRWGKDYDRRDDDR